MKKLNVLKPDVRTGYLNNGKGQEVTYLQVPRDVTLQELREDIDNGAAIYRELWEFAGKKPSQFVIINCDSEEEGMAAVSYLSAIYNHMEEVESYDFDDLEIAEEAVCNLDDFIKDDYELDGGEINWEDASDWEENPWRIPVVDSTELKQEDNIFSPMGFGSNSYAGMANPSEQLPYWYYTRRENMCIVHSRKRIIFGSIAGLTKQLKRYKNNRHVFLVVVAESGNVDEEVFDLPDDKDALWEVMLEYSADIVEVSGNDEQRKKYYEQLFENWVMQKGFDLDPKFPVQKMTHRILTMENEFKSALIEKVINYAVKDITDTRKLQEQDFRILERFKNLCEDKQKKEKKSIKKMQDELVGMDEVKEQILGIVEVMKYNKRRAAMGLAAGSYHNVHMLLGAPGTAKTTIAELLGNMMAEERLLGSNRFISVNGAELKGMYVGHSAPKVKALFDDYDIIFIDEAYAIAAESNGQPDSFSQEAIAQLIVELEKHGMDRLVMFAGYGGSDVAEKDNRMKQFLQSNPGIRSRINSTIYFKSYTPEEMVKIFRQHAKNNKFRISGSADPIVQEFFGKRVLQEDFGNGREARSLLENSIVESAKRLAKLPEEKLTRKMMTELQLSDIKRAIERMEKGRQTQIGVTKAAVGFR